MSVYKDSDNIEAARERLYQRGAAPSGVKVHGFTDEPNVVPTDWSPEPLPEPEPPPPLPEVVPETYNPVIAGVFPSILGRRHGYRLKLALVGLAFFFFALIVASLFMLFGKNSISGKNITIAVTVPFTIGGGEVMNAQVGIANHNSVALESAILIVEYPQGTKSDEETPRDLYTERIELADIKPGETLNMPLRARIFGEENSERTIRVSIEYRVQGSSARLYKEADPQTFKISSAPVSFKVDGVGQVASGQESSFTITVVSNSLTPLSEVLVKAEYPKGFSFRRSNPEPLGGKNAWLIENLEPGSSHTITVTGVISGQDQEQHVLKFTAGIPNERDQESFASTFATAEVAFEIERAFIDVGVRIGDSSDRVVSVEPGQIANGFIEISNTLDNSVYDLRVVLTPSGNAFRDGVVRSGNGFYDSTSGTIRWESSQRAGLTQLDPGESEQLSFSIRPERPTITDPAINIKIDIYARRVSDANAAEELLDSVERTVRVASVPVLTSSVDHGSQVFKDTGPIPPVVGKATTYTVSYRVENGTNDVNNVKVVTTLPLYVSWLDEQSGDGRFEYNQTTRTLTWNVGTIRTSGDAAASFQVSLLPSTSQIGTTPMLIGTQVMSATDSFTNTSLEASLPQRTTELSRESGYSEADGKVVDD